MNPVEEIKDFCEILECLLDESAVAAAEPPSEMRAGVQERSRRAGVLGQATAL